MNFIHIKTKLTKGDVRLLLTYFNIRSILLLTLLFFKTSSVIAQFDSLKWANYYSNHSVSSRDNLTAAQFFNKESLIMTCNTENDFTNFDISTIKLNINGEQLWNQTFSSIGTHNSNDFTRDMTIDSSGNVFVVASSNYFSNYKTPTIIKYDLGGNLLWSIPIKDYKGSDFEFGFCDIETDKLGNCYFLADAVLPGYSQPTTFLMKFDKGGTCLWIQTSFLYNPGKVIIDKNQDVFTVNYSDEQQNKKTIIQKYSKTGDLLSEHRYYNYYVDLIEAKIDFENNLWIFSNFSISSLADKKTVSILVSKYDTMGILIKQIIYDSQYHDYDAIRKVQICSDSTFLIGMDSYSSSNGIDNQFIIIDKSLQIIDSIRIDFGMHKNDYLISFDQSDNKSILVTGISYVDNNNFIPFVYKINKSKNVEWLKVPSLSSNIRTYPKDIFVDKIGTVYLVGDVRMTVNPSLDFDTHSNIFLTKIDSSGVEISTNEYGEEGKSYIVGSNVRLDTKENIYVSGFEQYGPIYEYVFHYYDQNIVLHKYNPEGESQWNRKIGPSNKYVGYTNHFISSDTLITVVASYGVSASSTVLYNYNSNGKLLDSAAYNRSVISAVTDNNGHFYLVFQKSPNFLIVKFDSNLNIEKEVDVPSVNYVEHLALFKKGYLYFISSQTNDVYKFDKDLNKLWNANLKQYSDFTSSLSVDESENVFISATKKNGRLIKLNPNGTIQWFSEVAKMVHSDFGVECLSSGDLVLLGSECSVSTCYPNGLALISKDGVLKKYVSTNCVIRKHRVDKDGCIYIFSNNNKYQKYSPALDLLVNDSFTKQNLSSYSLDINDVTINSKNEIIFAGSVGEWLLNSMCGWYNLAVVKVGQVNSPPFFIRKNFEIKLLPGDSMYIESPAIDYDQDTVTYKLLNPKNWIKLNDKTGYFSIFSTYIDTGYYNITLVASDLHGATDTSKISILIRNIPPYFTSAPITKSFAGKEYSYRSIAKDPENDEIQYKIFQGPIWLNVSKEGVVSGTPSLQDTGYFEIKLICYDEHQGEGSQIFTLQITQEKPDGVDDNFVEKEDIRIFPVPTIDWINIEIKQAFIENYDLQIIDANGKTIRNTSIYNDQMERFQKIYINGLSPGVYFLRFYNHNKTIVKRIIIQ